MATCSPLRCGRMLPRMIPILIIADSPVLIRFGEPVTAWFPVGARESGFSAGRRWRDAAAGHDVAELPARWMVYSSHQHDNAARRNVRRPASLTFRGAVLSNR